MAQKSENFLVAHRNNIFFLAICLVVLGLVFLLTVAKDLQSRRTLEEHLSEATRRAETQQLLAPLLAKLQEDGGQSAEADSDDLEGLPLPEQELTADRYEAIIGEIIRRCDLEQIALGPDLESVLMNTDTLRADLAVRGYFSNFRRLMLTLARLPFLSGIDSFHIEQSADGDRLDMNLKLRLKLESSEDGNHGRE